MAMGSNNGALTVVDQAQSRANLGLGDVAVLNLPITNANLQNSSVTINTSGTLSGGGNVSLGGTLNLVGSGGSGDVVGPAGATNNNFAAFDTNTGKLIKDSGVNSSTFFQVANNLSEGNASAIRTNLGLVIGTNVQAWDADLDAIAALSGTNGYLAKTAANTWALRTLTAGVGVSITNGNGTAGNPTIASSGGLILVSSQTASNVATIDFLNLNVYNMYKLFIHRAQPVTQSQPLRILVSQDNGANWITTAYTGQVLYTAYNSATFTNSNSTSFLPLSGPCNNGGSMTGELFMGSLNLPDYFTISGLAVWTDATLSATAIGRIGGIATTGINAIRLQFASGNISNGTFSLFGIKTA